VEPKWQRAREPDARTVWEQVLRPFAGELEANAGPLSHVIVAHIHEELPELFPDPESLEENRASTEASVRAVAQMIESGSEPRAVELPAATIAYTRSSVRRRVPFLMLTRSYRLAHEAGWDAIFAQLAARTADAEELERAAALCSAWIFAYVDVAITLAEQFYEQERERWLRTAAAAAAETIEEILAGHQLDTVQASARLRYQLERHHLGVVAWLDTADEDSDPPALLEAAVAQIATAMDARGVLAHPTGRLVLATWLGFGSPPSVEELDRLHLDAATTSGVRVALGDPGGGLAGFRATRAEAAHARRVASLSGRSAGTVTRYGRVALAAMASVDLEQARRFVARLLGELAGDDDVTLRLAATLRVYLDESASRSRAAKRLGIHENTVTYRIRQAEEILRHSIEESTLDLRVALALAPIVRSAGRTR
jgi:sugar diacid utilization regulator